MPRYPYTGKAWPEFPEDDDRYSRIMATDPELRSEEEEQFIERHADRLLEELDDD